MDIHVDFLRWIMEMNQHETQWKMMNMDGHRVMCSAISVDKTSHELR